MSRSLSVVALGTALWLLNVSSLLADDPPAAKPPIRTGQAAIEEELAKPIVLEFVETPLSDAIDFLKGHCKIEIQMDTRALTDVGIASDTPITKNLQGVSVRSALNLMLRDPDLTWTIRDEVLFITTPEEAESEMITKVYDVADLVVCLDSKGVPWDDYDSLIEIFTSTVMPTTWDAVGGPGSIAPANCGTAKAIVISQTYRLHCEIAELLASIRAIAKKNPEGKPPQREQPQSAKAEATQCFGDPAEAFSGLGKESK
jgi:hypothetical protein